MPADFRLQICLSMKASQQYVVHYIILPWRTSQLSQHAVNRHDQLLYPTALPWTKLEDGSMPVDLSSVPCMSSTADVCQAHSHPCCMQKSIPILILHIRISEIASTFIILQKGQPRLAFWVFDWSHLTVPTFISLARTPSKICRSPEKKSNGSSHVDYRRPVGPCGSGLCVVLFQHWPRSDGHLCQETFELYSRGVLGLLGDSARAKSGPLGYIL